MLDQFTITKAIHNNAEAVTNLPLDWNARSIYNYESHSQQRTDSRSTVGRLECSINLQLRKPFTTMRGYQGNTTLIGMLDQFTITKANHNYRIAQMQGRIDWNARSIYNYESHSQHRLVLCSRGK